MQGETFQTALLSHDLIICMLHAIIILGINYFFLHVSLHVVTYYYYYYFK